MDEAISVRLQLRYAKAEEGKDRGHEGVHLNYMYCRHLGCVVFVTPQ